MMRGRRRALGAQLPLVLLLMVACTPAELHLPDAETVHSYYEYAGRLESRISGNVAVISVFQPTSQLRRGGGLWAKVGPYIFLFSRETQTLFRDFNGLAAVRVVTKTSGGSEVASALLSRDALNDLTWRRALNVSGQARRDGTERPSKLGDLVRWGEDHTEFEYNPRYVGG